MKINYIKELEDKAKYVEQMRKPHMYTKFVDNAKREAGRIRGLIIEEHISDYFKSNYPQNYLEADNFEKWEQYCNHDFKLNIKGKIITIDVSGPQADGSFGSYYLKPKGVDYHIITSVIGMKSWKDIDFTQGFEIIGVVKGEDYNNSLDESKYIDFENWIKNIGLEI